jgi:SAM-dependent methyltransferase
MTWQHGYFADIPYTNGFYREMAPAWLDFAALLRGHRPPRRQGEAFRYLELGCGMGFGLILLATLHPEAQFSGIDFQPDHVLHGRRLAAELELDNIQFEEADFLALADAPQRWTDSYHYVAAHGIATWVTAPIQQALLAVASNALTAGGIFYCSYNTFPGWLGATAFQEFAEAQRRRSDPSAAGAALQGAAKTLISLLGSSESPSALGLAQPGLRGRLEQLPRQDSAYLLQEYANEGWQPLYVSEMHRRAAVHKLRFQASATLSENFDGLLPTLARETVQAETNPGLRQLLQDLAINQTFRRDLFVRSLAPLTPIALERQINGLGLRLQEAPPQEAYGFATSFGQVTGKAEMYGAVEESLSHGPRSIGELRQAHAINLPAMAQITALLLQAGRIGLDRGHAGAGAGDRCRRVNGVIRELQRESRGYSYLAAPSLGSAVAFSGRDAQLWHQIINHEPIAAADEAAAEALRQRRGSLETLGVV